MEKNNKYPGTMADGKYCANCQYPIDSNGFCNCGWNHFTQKRYDDDLTQILENPLDETDKEKFDLD
ncbi:MAG: hypothetical protein GF365_04590 [Candidatus Buchananbacteria bacterium]|nr:hypothetical protein [Candidatus Buchananbacteria bacterium]